MKGVLNFLGSILDYINPFSEKFFLKVLIEWIGNFFIGLRDLFISLFVPEDNYFTNKIDDIKYKISQKLPYQDYMNMFETVKQVESGEDISISLDNYKVGNMNLNMPKFINFSFITKYKNTWYAWVRGFIFVFLIIYNINQIIKLLRGYNVADGVNQLNNSSGGVNK